MDGKWDTMTDSRSKRSDVSVQMEEQTHRFALDKSLPVNGKLQISDGKVIVRCSNLKPEGRDYKMLFIGRKNGSSVYKIVGDILPDAQGNAELRCAVDPANIDGEGTDLSCFYIFMVAAIGKPLQPVLKGDIWDDMQRQNNNTGDAQKRRDYSAYYNEYILAKFAVLESGNSELAVISPFDDVWIAEIWRRVTDLMKLPVASVGAETQAMKYGHFIFGYTEEHFCLAVPGRHSEEEWPDRGRSGFALWRPIRGSQEYGYWAMVIDRRTGMIKDLY